MRANKSIDMNGIKSGLELAQTFTQLLDTRENPEDVLIF